MWDGTYSDAGTCNGGLASAELAAAAAGKAAKQAQEAAADVTAVLSEACCFCLSRPKQDVSVRIASTDRFFRPQHGHAEVRIRLKREYHIQSMLVRIYRNYDNTNRLLPAGGIVYQEVLSYTQVAALTQKPRKREKPDFAPQTPEEVEKERKAFLEKTAKDGDGSKWAAWKDTPFKVRIWVSSVLTPAQMFKHAADRTEPAEVRGRTAHDQSTWRNRVFKNKTTTGGDEFEARDILVDRPGVNLITLGYIAVDGFSSGKGNGDLVLGRKIASIIDEQFGTRCLVVSNHPTLMLANFPGDQVFFDGSDLKAHMNKNMVKEVKPEHMVPAEYPEPPIFVQCGPQGGSKAIRYPEFGAVFADKSPKTRIPLVKFTEYGCGHHDEKNDQIDFLGGLGLGKGDIGVFVDRELWDRRGIGRELLGMLLKGAAPSEQDANKALHAALTDGKYDERRLYHGYCQGISFIQLFFDVAMADATLHKQDIDLTIPVRFDASAAPDRANLKLDFTLEELDVKKRVTQVSDYRRELLRRRLRLLQAADVREVRVVTPKGNFVAYQGPDHAHRIVRIVDFFRLSNRTFKVLLSASDRLCLATGDQSWTEAVSADKDIIYELGHHKENAMAAWREVAEQCGVKKDSPMLRMLDLCTTGVFDLDHPNSAPDKVKERLAYVVPAGAILDAVAEAPLRSQQFAAVNELIVEKYDCLPKVVEIVDRALAAYPLDDPDGGQSSDREHVTAKSRPFEKKPQREWKRYGGLEDHYHILPTTGDGNCLFRAVSAVLNGDSEDQHLVLRQAAVLRIRNRPLVYTDELLRSTSLVPFVDRGTYLDVMNVAAANAGDVQRWGGHPELAALSAGANRPIHVHSSDPAVEVRGCTRIEGDADNPSPHDAVPIHVLYEGGNHYLAMRPR